MKYNVEDDFLNDDDENYDDDFDYNKEIFVICSSMCQPYTTVLRIFIKWVDLAEVKWFQNLTFN